MHPIDCFVKVEIYKIQKNETAGPAENRALSSTRVLRRNQAQTVTGIVVNDRPGVPRELRRRLRAILHRAKSEGLERQNRENHPHFEGWVRGMLAYTHMVNAEQAQRLWRELRGNS